MGLNFAAAAAGYQGYKQEERQLAEDEQQAAAAARAAKDNAFVDEVRARQRADWKQTDRIKADDKADLLSVNAQFAQHRAGAASATAATEQATAEDEVRKDQTHAEIAQALDQTTTAPERLLSDRPAAPAPSTAKQPDAPVYTAPKGVPDAAPTAPQLEPNTAPTSPRLAPAVSAKLMELRGAAGVPRPQSFNDTLEIQTELARRKNARGDLSPKDYAQQLAFIQRTHDEGVHHALSTFARGDYEGGVATFNRVGNNTGAQLIKGEQGNTDIDGRAHPTHFVTLENPDGTRSRIDVVKAQNQLRDLGSQLVGAERIRQRHLPEKQ